MQKQDSGKLFLADTFRFDVLLSRAEPAAQEAGPESEQCVTKADEPAPAAVVIAQSEPVATVEMPLQASLDLRTPGLLRVHPHFRPVQEARPQTAREVAQIGESEVRVQEILRSIPGLEAAQKQRIEAAARKHEIEAAVRKHDIEVKVQCELQRVSVQLSRMSMDDVSAPVEMQQVEVMTQDSAHAAPPQCGN